MRFKKIVGFGDSWIWGDELLDPLLADRPDAHPVLVENTLYRESKCFLGLLGNHYKIPVENFGIAGGSMQSAVWTYMWWLENEKLDPRDCLILVGHTDANRTSFYNPAHVSYPNDPPWNRFIHSAWVHNGSNSVSRDWETMVKLNMVLTDCRASSKLNYQQNLLFYEGQHHALSKNILQFCTIGYPEIISASNLAWTDSSLKSLLGNHREWLAPCGHPNELGHEELCNILINQINRVILA